jgi:PAS domain S-box-containing protein
MPTRSELLVTRERLRAELAEVDAELGEGSEHSRDQLASLLDEVQVGVWSLSLRTHRMLYMNAALARIFGRPREAFPVENASLIAWIHPDDQEAGQTARRAVFDSGQGRYDLRVVWPDGQVRWCRFQSHEVRGAGGAPERLDMLVEDITEQRAAEDALQHNERRWRRLMEQGWEVVWAADAARARHQIGGRRRQIAGWDPDELLALPLPSIVHADDLAHLIDGWREAETRPGEAVVREYRLRRKAGGWLWVEGAVVNLLDDPDVRAFVGHTREIHERKLAEEALAQANVDLERRVAEATAGLLSANARLTHAAQAKDAFLANMSHELRTPLNAVLGLSEALQEEVYGEVSERQKTALRQIEQSGRHLLSLIGDILDLSKIEAGKAEISFATVGVGEVCRAALGMIQGMARQKHIAVTTHISDGFALMEADERKLKQILVNLLSNAVKFTPENGSAGLEVDVSEAEGIATFSVWDTGVGIRAEDLPRLFQPFVQLDSSLSRQHTGSGLGLALVRALVDLHGGSVTAESEHGKRSRFTVRLPLRRRAEPTPASGLPRALIVEDSAPVAEQLARYLREMGVEALVHGQAAGVVERAADEQPSIILLDILLPAETGWRVLADLKADVRTSHIPVIVVSVLDRREQSLSLGAADQLPKPVDREQVQAAVARLTGGRKPQRPALIATTTHAPEEPKPTPQEGPATRLLLAEDDEVNVRPVIDFLRIKGYEVYVARDGREAVQLGRELRPDVILMDIQMPGMDGLTAIRTLKADPAEKVRRMPIIALTALAMTGDRERCLEAGADEYLAKPVSLKQLATLLQNVLARRAAR